MLDQLYSVPAFDAPTPDLAGWFRERDAARERSCGELEALVRELAARADLWRHLAARAGTPHGVRLYGDAFLEAALVCWPRSGRHPLHDHGPSRGAIAVVEGAVTE